MITWYASCLVQCLLLCKVVEHNRIHIYVTVCCRPICVCVIGIIATVTLCILNCLFIFVLLFSHCVSSSIIDRATSYLVNKRFIYKVHCIVRQLCASTHVQRCRVSSFSAERHWTPALRGWEGTEGERLGSKLLHVQWGDRLLRGTIESQLLEVPFVFNRFIIPYIYVHPNRYYSDKHCNIDLKSHRSSLEL